MTTPPQEPIEAALVRADAGLLARHLDARTCSPELLGRLVRHPDPRVRHLGLALLAERTSPPYAVGTDQQELLADLLPDGAGTTPEESLVLAELHGRLRGGHRPLPDRRSDAWPAPVRTAWLRTELLADPAVARTEPAGEPLYQAVRSIAVLDAHRPERLVAELAATGDPVLQDEALRLARAGLHAGLLAPARRLLLAGLDGVPSARSVLARYAQNSPVAPALLALVADGGVRLSSGSVQDLSEPLAELGLLTGRQDASGRTAVADPEVADLLRGGWDPALALRIARRAVPPDPALARELPELRTQLDRWLALADSTAPARLRLLWCALRLCPAPWTADEVAVLGRHAGTVAEAFEEAVGGGGPEECAVELLDAVDAVEPALSAVQRFTVVEQLRALRRVPPVSPALTLSLLRRCGAVLVRADVDRALAAAHLGPDPWRTAPDVLREAFGLPEAAAGVPADGREALREAVRTSGALAELRRSGVDGVLRGATGVPRSRQLLHALIEAYPAAGPDVRGPLLDWMTALQPLGAPPWTVAETHAASTPLVPKVFRLDDPDQPHSSARQERLLAMLEADDPDRRNAAARVLAGRPEPEVALAVVRAYLRGRVEGVPDAAVDRLARTPAGLDTVELCAEEVLPERALRCAGRLRPWDLPPLVPMLLDRWQHGPPAARGRPYGAGPGARRRLGAGARPARRGG
ncbi:hypothetical protein [Streptomyces sp. bgisy029]|uniref:hypothetical protein n=1 Tax=Streptomyces sp. bgisy029 TaxID=3413771 RepID=UPI003D709E6D